MRSRLDQGCLLFFFKFFFVRYSKSSSFSTHKTRCSTGRSLIQPQRSNPEQLGHVWTQHSSLIQVWIWIVIKYNVVDTAKVSDTEWMWSNEIKNYLFCFCAIHYAVEYKSPKINIWRKILFNFWNLKWEKFYSTPPHFCHLPQSLIPKIISIQQSSR